MTAEATITVGSKLADRFKITGELGFGGSGRVFQAYDEHHNEEVAIKALHVSDPETLLELKNEFLVLSDVRHPNLVRLKELHDTSAPYFVTMELVSGTPIQDWLWTVPAFPGFTTDMEARLIRILPQWLAAVDAMHARKLVHRDIKPANTLVDSDGRVVVIDFGLVAESWRKDPHTAAAGTPQYWAPEQLQGNPKLASDWYSLGASVFFLLTGFAPPMFIASGGWEFLAAAPERWRLSLRSLLEPDHRARTGSAAFSELLNIVPRQSIAPVDFVGRDDSITQIRAAIADVTRVHVLCVTGESGIGKTELLRTALAGAECYPPLLVLSGRCRPTRSASLRALDPVVDELARFLRRRPEEASRSRPNDTGPLLRQFPALASVAEFKRYSEMGNVTTERESRMRAEQALRQLLVELSEHWRIVIWIDDAQWGDLDSLAQIGALLNGPVALPIVLATSYRPEAGLLVSGLRKLATEHELPIIDVELGPLDEKSALRLLQSTLGEAAVIVNNELLDDAAGSPFLLLEIVRHFEQQGVIPESLRGSLNARMKALTATQRESIDIAATIGHPLSVSDLIDVASIAVRPEEIIELVSASWLRRRTDAQDFLIECYHDRIREHVASTIDDAVMRQYHTRIAARLAQVASTPKERLIEHLLAAGNDSAAAKHAAAAGNEAFEQYAYTRAIEHFHLAATRTDIDPETRSRYARALSEVGRVREAAEMMTQVAGHPTLEHEKAENWIFIAQSRWRAGERESALEAIETVATLHGTKLPRGDAPRRREASVRHYLTMLQSLRQNLGPTQRPVALPQGRSAVELLRLSEVVSATSTQLGDWLATLALQLALRYGTPEMCLEVLLRESTAQSGFGSRYRDIARRTLLHALRTKRSLSRTDFKRAYRCFNIGGVHYFRGEFRRAAWWFKRAEYLRWASGTPRAQAAGIVDGYICYSSTWLGDIGEIKARCERDIAQAKQLNEELLLARIISHESCVPDLAADRPDLAIQRLEGVPENLRIETLLFYAPSLWRVLAYQGNFEAAWAHARYAWPILQARKVVVIDTLNRLLRYSRALIALGAARTSSHSQNVQLKHIAEADGIALGKTRLRMGRPLQMVVEASILGLQGDAESAVCTLRGAVPLFKNAEMPLMSALTAWQLGNLDGATHSDLTEATEAGDWLRARGIVNIGAFSRSFLPVVSRYHSHV